jgi:hypothetical protein
VPRRLRAAVEDLRSVAPPDRQPALDRQPQLLEAATRRPLEDEEDAGERVVRR